ncbi:hypothetical protein Pfo_026562 [Paulownia fortunei]|nr:hypothetical protein Pfo_026562 [Paulownia fortunei]
MIFFIFTTSARASIIGIFQHYEVHIINSFNDNTDELIVHCKSGDDDLGEHFLDKGDDWHWKFRVNFFRSTLFFCHVQWGEFEKRFTEEGIYFSCDDKNYVKKHIWP